MKLNMKTSVLLCSALTLLGCKDRSEVVNYGQNLVDFSDGYVQKMPTTISNSEKRSQGDLDCDGIEDMFEINDTKFWGQEYKINFYKGYMDGDKRMFEPPKVVDLGLKLNNWSSQVKMDSAYLDYDQCIDIVFVDVSKKNIRMEVAMNQGNLKFTKDTMKMKVNPRVEFLGYFRDLIEEISLSEDETLSDYLKMDWADWDGNGTDDFLLFMKDGRSLHIGIFYTESASGLVPEFASFEEEWVQDFLYNTPIRTLDTGDLNGDGKSDVTALYKESNSKGVHTAKYVIAVQDEEGNIVIQPDKTLKAKVDLDFFKSVSKRDLTDENHDGKDDIIYITEENNVPIRVIWHSE